MNKQKIKKLVAFTLVTGALASSTSYKVYAANVNTDTNYKQETTKKSSSIKDLEAKLDKQREDFYKLQNDKMALDEKNKSQGKLEWEKEAKKNIQLEKEDIANYENETDNIYNAETKVKVLLKESDEVIRGLDKTNVTQEEIKESLKKTDEALKLAKKYKKIMDANFMGDPHSFMKATSLVRDVERKIYDIKRLKENAERYAKEQLALRMEENRTKDEAFIALQNIISELKNSNFDMTQNQIDSIISLANKAVLKAYTYKNVVKTDSNASEDLINNAEKAVIDANEQLELANRLKTISKLKIDVKDLSSRKKVRNFCSKLEEINSLKLDEKSKVALENIQKDYIKYLEKFCSNVKNYEDGLQLPTNISDFVSVVSDNKLKEEAIKIATNCINNEFTKLKNQHKMNSEFVKGLSKSLHNLSESETTSKTLDLALKLYEKLGNRINNQIYFVDKCNKDTIESIIRNLKDGQEPTSKLFALGEKLEKDFNYASKPWLVQKIGTGIVNTCNSISEGTLNAYNDVNNTGLEIYNTGKNVCEAISEVYQSREEIMTVTEDGISFGDLIKGKISELIKSPKKEVEIKEPTFMEYIKNKFDTISKTFSTALEVTKTVWNANDVLNNCFNEKHTSVLAPVTNRVSNICASINRSANATKCMVKASKAYVVMKNTAITVKNVASSITSKISGLFGY